MNNISFPKNIIDKIKKENKKIEQFCYNSYIKNKKEAKEEEEEEKIFKLKLIEWKRSLSILNFRRFINKILINYASTLNDRALICIILSSLQNKEFYFAKDFADIINNLNDKYNLKISYDIISLICYENLSEEIYKLIKN